MAVPEPIEFQLVNIRTDEFAVIAENRKHGETNKLNSNLSFGFISDDQVVMLNAKFSFSQENNIFLVIAITCVFKIVEKHWTTIYKPENGELNLPKSAALYFANLTIGTARGVIYVKTEQSELGQVILPPMSIQNIITSDVIIKK